MTTVALGSADLEVSDGLAELGVRAVEEGGRARLVGVPVGLLQDLAALIINFVRDLARRSREACLDALADLIAGLYVDGRLDVLAGPR